MKLSREVKTALLVILGIVLLIFSYNYLKGEDLLESNNTYYTEFDYNALTTSSPVTIKGNNIGKVHEIKYEIESGKTRVSFTVDSRLEFSKNSRIRMYEMGLMGGNGIAIIPAEDGAAVAKDGDFLNSEVEQGLVQSLSKNFSGLSTGLDITLRRADSLLLNVNRIIQDEGEEGLKHAVMELNLTLASFRSTSNNVRSLIAKNEDSLSMAIANFNKITTDLAVFTEDLKGVQLSKTVNDLEGTLDNVNSIMAGLNNGEGSLGKLLTDDKLYHNLEVASLQLRELLQDFKLNPKRYVNVSVFGGKNKDEYVKPEDERQ